MRGESTCTFELTGDLKSIWVFLLLASESIKSYKANPYLEYVFATWVTSMIY